MVRRNTTIFGDLNHWMNDTDKGQIKNDAQLATIRKFIEEHSTVHPKVEKDEVKQQTNIKGSGKVTVSLLKSTHIS